MKEVTGYRVEWRPGDPCYYSPSDFAKEIHTDTAIVYELHIEPLGDVEVYKSWYWIRPKYLYGRSTEGMTPMYRGRCINKPSY